MNMKAKDFALELTKVCQMFKKELGLDIYGVKVFAQQTVRIGGKNMVEMLVEVRFDNQEEEGFLIDGSIGESFSIGAAIEIVNYHLDGEGFYLDKVKYSLESKKAYFTFLRAINEIEIIVHGVSQGRHKVIKDSKGLPTPYWINDDMLNRFIELDKQGLVQVKLIGKGIDFEKIEKALNNYEPEVRIIEIKEEIDGLLDQLNRDPQSKDLIIAKLNALHKELLELEGF